MAAKRETSRAKWKKAPLTKTRGRQSDSKPVATRVVRVRDVLGTNKPVTAKMIREGLPPAVIGHLSEQLDMSTTRTLRVVNLSKQTFARRQRAGKLTAEESDRVWRVTDLIARAMLKTLLGGWSMVYPREGFSDC